MSSVVPIGMYRLCSKLYSAERTCDLAVRYDFDRITTRLDYSPSIGDRSYFVGDSTDRTSDYRSVLALVKYCMLQ